MTAGEATASRLRWILGPATAGMMALSWPLWVEPSALPRVPIVASIPSIPPWLSWLVFATIEAALIGSALGFRPRWLLGVSVALIGGLVAADQQRFQPWIYQFLLLATALAVASAGRAVWLARGLVIALYLHSGLSKLDASFASELGPQLLDAATHLVGMEGSPGSPAVRSALAWGMPAFEIAVALLLIRKSTRCWGVVGAVAMHAALIALLGPFGLRHSAIVLAWNATMLVEAVVLVWPDLTPWTWRQEPGDTIAWPLAVGLFALAGLLPFAERSGWFDTWPSFALYASHAERMEILIGDDDADQLGPDVGPYLFPGPVGWRRLDLTAWSRATRGTPVYPQNRAALGVAIGLLERRGGPSWARVILWGRASAISGRRDRVELAGPEAIRRHADRYGFGALPATDGGRVP